MGAHCTVRPLLFRVNVSSTIGMGHLMRCLALAQAAEASDIPCHFVVDVGGKALAIARQDWIYPVTEIPALPDNQAGEWLSGLASEIHACAVIADGYDISVEQLQPVKESGIPLVVMDDGQRSLVAQASLIVNSTTSALDEKYMHINPRATVCSGSQYRLMRREFQQGANIPFERRHGIALCIGGSDPKGLTVPLISALSETLTDVPIRVITGAAFKGLQELQGAIKASALPIQHIHNCQDMADVWRHCKLAISAAGGSQFELGVCETPSILLMVAENQRMATAHVVDEGWCEAFDCTARAPVYDIAKRVKTLWQNPGQLAQMHDALAGRYRADGAERLLNAIAEVI